MLFSHSKADIFVPDGIEQDKALTRTTHLCIATHPDDIEIFAYNGIAECFGQKEKWFSGVVVTNGSGSPRAGIYADYTDEQMQEIRQQEQRKAAFVGEYGIQIQLAHPSSAVKDANNNDVVNDIMKICEIAKPEVVYLHNPADKHFTHVAVLMKSLEAIRKLPKEIRPKKAYGCEVWRDLDWVLDEDKIALPTDKYKNIASALVEIFDSQISGGKRYDLATEGRRYANATYHSSHEIDNIDAMTFALDLMPLILNDSLSLSDFTKSYLEKFANDVLSKINSFSCK